MSELQATVEFSVELYKFYNVDLFQRGFYQIRTTLRLSPKLPVKVEVTLPKSQRTDFVFPACVVNGAGVSKTFQILYRNEEVLLDDVIVFRAHILVDSHKIEDTLDRADFTLSVELWFTDQTFGPEPHTAIACVSSRTLQLHFSPTRGLHYHLPVLFDYFHLAAVTLTIHASLVALHQPYINTPRSAKPWLGGSQKLNFRQPQSTMETVFFGNMNSTKCVSSGSRLAHARHVHQEVCSILLASYETLQLRLREYTKLLPSWQQLKVESADCFQRFSNLSDLAKLVEVEEEFVALANSDIAQLCAENILLWQQFLEAFTLKDPVHQHLAQAHHHLRVRRFAEAFFVLDNPRQSAAGCYDANYQNYLTVSDMVRRSRYLATLPPLPVQCLELDGDLATMPIIFEDQYQDMAEFARRRSVAGRKAESDPFLNVAGVENKTESRCSLPQQDDCSCGISAILESRSHKIPRSLCATQPASAAASMLGLHGGGGGGGIVTATLTLAPGGGGGAAIVLQHHTLPARHHSKSKSLDYLRAGAAETLPTRGGGAKKAEQHVVSSSAPNPTIMHEAAGLPREAAMARSSSAQMRRERNTDLTAAITAPKLPAPLRNNLKEKLKNNLRLELKVANGNGVLTSPSTDSNDSVPGVGGYSRRLEQSASVPFNLSETSAAGDGGCSAAAMRHSQSTVSMPAAAGLSNNHAGRRSNEAMAAANSSESMPNLVAPMSPLPIGVVGTLSPVLVKLSGMPMSPSKVDIEIPPGLPANDKAKLEIGLYGSTDDALISVESSLAEVLKSKSKSLSSPPSSSLSEITSEQSGWVSNSSRRTSGDMSSGQLSPESDRGTAAANKCVKPKPVAAKPEREINSDQLLDRLQQLAKPGAEPSDPPPVPPLDHPYEELHLPPPKMFRDVPPPPEPFRDPPLPPANGVGPEEAIDGVDNLLYHVYESVKEVERQQQAVAGGKNKKKGKRKGKDLVLKLEAESSKKTPSPKPADGPSGSRPGATTPGAANADRTLAACECYGDKDPAQKLVTPPKEDAASFGKHKDDFKRQMNFTGMLYSDFPTLASTLPYFHISDDYRMFSPEGLHLIVCVHGLDGNSADLRLVKTYLELGLPGANLEFLMSERNQGDTFSDFDSMTDKLVGEILYHVEACGLNPTKISFVGHSLGNIIIRSAIARPQMKHLLPRLHTFLSLSGPHLGTMYNNSGLVNMGMWFMQKWKKSGSLLQLSLRDSADVRQSFLYRLSQRSNLQHFRNVLLCGSSQDRYVPLHSARIELCKAAVKDATVQGSAYREMVHNILYPIINKPELTFVRYDVHHALPNTANSLIGRAAHIAVLDSELFIEKFLVVTGLKYFR